jgi:hypothetical protein
MGVAVAGLAMAMVRRETMIFEGCIVMVWMFEFEVER